LVNSAIQTELLRNYGMRENPFNVTPDPRFLYESRTHREALASLITGIECGTGFQALIAPPGMGKTTLLFNVLERFQATARTAFLFQTQCNSREFLQYLLFELGVEPGDRDLVRMHERLNQVLTQEGLAHRRVIVIIDEAQNLDNSVLETVRLLSDFETRREKLMQIIISGQPELARKLASPELEQLHQRLQVITRLTPLNQEEITAYIDHRLKKSGYAGSQLFTPEALRLVAKHSHGTPRKINTICFNALLLAFARENNLIDAYMVDEVVADLQLRGDDAEAEMPALRPVRLSSTLPFMVRPVANTAADGQKPANEAGSASSAPATQAPAGFPPPKPPQPAASAPAAQARAPQMVPARTQVATAPSMPAQGPRLARPASAAHPSTAPSRRPPARPAPMPSMAPRLKRQPVSKNGWAGPIFAGIVCLALLGAIEYFYKRGNSPDTGGVVAAHSQVGQSRPAAPSRTPAQPAGTPAPANQSHSITDLTVPPESFPGSTNTSQTNTPAGQDAQPEPSTAAPGDQQSLPDNNPSETTDQPQTRAAAQQRSPRNTTRSSNARRTAPPEPEQEVVTRNFNSQPAGLAQPAAQPSPANSAVAQPNSAATQPPAQPSSIAALPNRSAAPTDLNSVSVSPAANTESSAPAPENVTLPERAARARLVYKVAPEFPRDAAGSTGASVILQAVVGKDGTVRDLQLVSGSPRLAEAAMDAASRWQFQPYKVNGQTVEFTTQIHVDFNAAQ
jgi:TonB family protein